MKGTWILCVALLCTVASPAVVAQSASPISAQATDALGEQQQFLFEGEAMDSDRVDGSFGDLAADDDLATEWCFPGPSAQPSLSFANLEGSGPAATSRVTGLAVHVVSEPRPARVSLSWGQERVPVTFQNRSGWHIATLEQPVETNGVTLAIEVLHPPGPDAERACIAEVVFFGRASSAEELEPVGEIVMLSPTGYAASSQMTSGETPTGPAAAFDKDYQTAWAEGADGDGAFEWIEGQFDAPHEFTQVQFSTGYDSVDEDGGDRFSANPHIREFIISVDGREMAYREVDEGQRFIVVPFEDRGRTVRVSIEAVWPGTHSNDLRVSEIDIFGRPLATPDAPPAADPTPRLTVERPSSFCTGEDGFEAWFGRLREALALGDVEGLDPMLQEAIRAPLQATRFDGYCMPFNSSYVMRVDDPMIVLVEFVFGDEGWAVTNVSEDDWMLEGEVHRVQLSF